MCQKKSPNLKFRKFVLGFACVDRKTIYRVDVLLLENILRIFLSCQIYQHQGRISLHLLDLISQELQSVISSLD